MLCSKIIRRHGPNCQKLRPRIKPESVAVGGFQITKVTSDGSNNPVVNNSDEEDPSNNAPLLPFVLVEASWVQDIPITSNDDMQRLKDFKKDVNAAIMADSSENEYLQ